MSKKARIWGFAVFAALAGPAAGASPAFGQSGADVQAASANHARIVRIVGDFNSDVAVDGAFRSILIELAGVEYRTPADEIRWAADFLERDGNDDAGWGEVVVLAYLQATTGWSFAELVEADAHKDLEGFVDTMEMSAEKMAESLDAVAGRARREQNSRIFDRIRSAPRSHALPDLGAGFGLFQEALDFRNLDPPAPTKVHDRAVFGAPFGGGQ